MRDYPRCASCKKLLEDCGCDASQGVLKVSPFAAALVRLLDETMIFNRDQWARLFGVPSQLLEAWASDTVFPRADYLRILLDLLNHSADVPKEPLDAFSELLLKPIEEISPILGPALRVKTLKAFLQRDLRRAKRYGGA